MPKRAKRGDEVQHKNGATGIVLHVRDDHYSVGACNIVGSVSEWKFEDVKPIYG